MPELIRFTNPEYHSLIWQINESVEGLLKDIPLSEFESEYFAQMKTERRKKQWLAYRRALMAMNGEVHVPIIYNEVGKPVLEDLSSSISVSHSGDFAHVMVSRTGRVGVDIEVISETAHRVRHKFMGFEEIDFADAVCNRLISLYSWCAKEAMYKAMGQEGVIFAKDMKVYDFNFETNTAKGKFLFDNANLSFDICFFQHEEFVAAMCYGRF